MSEHISIERLRELLEYRPDTGKLFWRERQAISNKNRAFNGQFANKEAGAINKDGHIHLSIREPAARLVLLAHRVAWAMYFGQWPADQIDHRNRCGTDNRIGNLRLATHAQNAQNKGVSRDNTSGYVGVSFFAKTGKWRAIIRVNGRNMFIGKYSDKIDAAIAYDKACLRFRGEFAVTNFPQEDRHAS